MSLNSTHRVIIGFSRPKHWKLLSWLIMTSYDIPYSHVYIKFYSTKYDRWLIYQASGTMVNFMNVVTFEEKSQVVREVGLYVSSDSESKIIQFAIDNCGKPYGFKEIVGLAWVKICEWFGKEIKNPFSNQGRSLICSELASMILRDCLSIELPKDPDDMTPLDVYNLITSKITY